MAHPEKPGPGALLRAANPVDLEGAAPAVAEMGGDGVVIRERHSAENQECGSYHRRDASSVVNCAP